MMLNVSRYLHDGVEAWFTDARTDFSLPEAGEVFGAGQTAALAGIGIDADRVVNIRQVHRGTVLMVPDSPGMMASEKLLEADALVTRSPKAVLAIRTADCVPVFLVDPQGRCAGLVHAGWRSIRERIMLSTIRMMQQECGSCPQDIRAVFGPSVHSCCYEVGQEFCGIFPEAMMPRLGRWFLDLQAVGRRQMTDGGILPENIADCGLCTCCGDGFFSYRRQGRDAGRHLSILKMH